MWYQRLWMDLKTGQLIMKGLEKVDVGYVRVHITILVDMNEGKTLENQINHPNIDRFFIFSMTNFVSQARYAFELLTNKIWKRDYDLYSIDEQFVSFLFFQHVVEKAKEQYVGRSISEITFPLLETISIDPEDHAVDVINSENFLSKLGTDKALLIQIFSPGSARCAQFSNKWKRIVTLLDGVADTGVIDVADVQLATYLAEKRPGGLPYFRHGKYFN
uniref:Uncharacterized protein n=1 Tax=Solanum lycopersicum TaxID=4081 RepID=A0A3Q7GH10_SOLLC